MKFLFKIIRLSKCHLEYISAIIVIFVQFCLLANVSLAGGYDTGGRNWDSVFNEEDFSFETEVRYVAPKRSLKNVQSSVSPASTSSVKETEGFITHNVSVSQKITDRLQCLLSFRQPWEGHADYGAAWVGAASAIEQHFSSSDYGLTCAASIPLRVGIVRPILGGSYQKIRYELVQGNAQIGRWTTDVEDQGFGWRIGLGYDLRDYGVRASLIYNSAINYDMTGTLRSSLNGQSTDVFGSITMPQALEFKAQSGIAANWLAFGSVKWTDWSVADAMPLCVRGSVDCSQANAVSGLTLLWQDSWSITAGLARRASESLTLSSAVTWDQGASQGFTSQTDTWTASLNATWQPSKSWQFSFGGTLGVLTSGDVDTSLLAKNEPNPVGYRARFGNDYLYSLAASVKWIF